MIHARLTIVETIHYQPPVAASRAESIMDQFSRQLTTDDQPCTRRLTATEEWKKIDGCWLEQASMVAITNETGKNRQTFPSKEELEEIAKTIIEVSFDGGLSPAILVHPGQLERFTPIDFSRIKIRCRHGVAKFSAAIFPL